VYVKKKPFDLEEQKTRARSGVGMGQCDHTVGENLRLEPGGEEMKTKQ